MWQGKYYSGRDNPIIRYPLEICRGRPLDDDEFSPDLAREYAGLDEAIVKSQTPYFYAWMESDVPLFHPGRVMVTHEVMTRLGRMNVLLYLNYHVRGGWADGAAAGEASQYDLDHDKVIWSSYHLTGSLCLSVCTSGNRCRTVIRMRHERLAAIRATERLTASADDGESESVSPIAPRSAKQQDGLSQFDDESEIPF